MQLKKLHCIQKLDPLEERVTFSQKRKSPQTRTFQLFQYKRAKYKEQETILYFQNNVKKTTQESFNT